MTDYRCLSNSYNSDQNQNVKFKNTVLSKNFILCVFRRNENRSYLRSGGRKLKFKTEFVVNYCFAIKLIAYFIALIVNLINLRHTSRSNHGARHVLS